jgi:hypothetical protein
MRSVRVADFDKSEELRSIFEDDGLLIVDGCPDDFDVTSLWFEELFGEDRAIGREVGKTKISSDETGRSGLGYTNSALFPHTDRSGLENPPRTLLFAMHRPCAIGGDSLLVHGDDIVAQLLDRSPAAIDVLTGSECLFFRGEHFVRKPVLRHRPDGRFDLRFRFDSMGFFPRDLIDVLPTLLDAIRAATVRVSLKRRQGFLIDNHRVLHGRTGFVGTREGWRFLGA